MDPTVRLLRIRGITVGAHWTWAAAVAVVVWTLAGSVFPSAYPDIGPGLRIVMALAAAGLLFVSVVLHELAHAVVARRQGLPVEGITLWLLGGLSDVSGRAESPGRELRVAASGPGVSLLLAALFAAASRLGGPDAVTGVLEYVARLNVVVAAFNLLPALPLDGGRILRSWLWHRQRDLLAATRSCTRAGRAFGATLIIVGVLNLWGGTGLMGLWLVVLGGFLLRAVSSELTDARTRHRLDGLTAGDVMASDPGVVLDDTPVARLVDHPPPPERSGYPVLGRGRLLGVVVLASARSVPAGERARLRVEQVMTPLDDVPMVNAGDPVVEVLKRLNGTNHTGQVVVVDDGCVVGILDEVDVACALDGANAQADAALEREPVRRAGIRTWAAIGALCLLVGAALYRPPYVVVSPGRAVDVTGAVTVSGVAVTDVNGRYVATGVEVRRTSALGALVATVRDGYQVVRSSEGDDLVAEEEAASRRSRETRMLAAAAAALSQGLPVTVTGTGAQVVTVRAGSPSDGRLRPGDVIVAADGQPISRSGLLTEVVRRRRPGTALRLSVERAGAREEVAVTLREAPGPGLGAGLGVTVETRDLAVELPFEVTFAGQSATGPGAGLAYALAIADIISSRDLAQGRTIAATGMVDGDGHVGPVGAVSAQAGVADRAGAALFVVPAEEADEARGDGPRVEGVESLVRAVEALSTTV